MRKRKILKKNNSLILKSRSSISVNYIFLIILCFTFIYMLLISTINNIFVALSVSAGISYFILCNIIYFAELRKNSLIIIYPLRLFNKRKVYANITICQIRFVYGFRIGPYFNVIFLYKNKKIIKSINYYKAKYPQHRNYVFNLITENNIYLENPLNY